MKNIKNQNIANYLKDMKISTDNFHYQLTPDELINQTVELKQGKINSQGALVINTFEKFENGKITGFTGRSPKDKLTVKDANTEKNVFWSEYNIAYSPENFDILYQDVIKHLSNKTLWVRDAIACDHPSHHLKLRVVNEAPWCNLFAYNMFIRPDEKDLDNFQYEWQVIQAPSFNADPKKHGTRQGNFSVINFSKKIILIGGSKYTGEMKKGIFTVLNYILPIEKNVLGMHCSANKKGDNTAIFFGLSGTGKTTLSADPERELIGDDEHGWSDKEVFNFEGGCYAKTIGITEEKEPEIYRAIKHGALVENVPFLDEQKGISDYESKIYTENTRVSYPLHFIKNSASPAIGNVPQNIFFLTCDAFGVLPPISKLTTGQAMYQFLSGYTAKIAGTEAGIIEPTPVFSACFGAPFLPLNPTKYAEMLGKKLQEHKTNVWLVNTGWSGGKYGEGSRMKLSYTRAVISEAMNENLLKSTFIKQDVFGFEIPTTCKNVPSNILNPIDVWADKDNFKNTIKHLAELFVKNFKNFENFASEEIKNASPKI